MSSEHDVASLIQGLYQELGNWQAFRQRLDPHVTVWESDAEQLLHGTAQVEELRGRRRAAFTAADVPLSVKPENVIIDVWADGAVARYILRAVYPSTESDRCYRVTDVLRCGDAGWHIVHHHSEALSPRDRASVTTPTSG
ncbi:nuclear transport factor 2 family protein [Streptomyces sp. NPDC005566]|uniref:nuclear transport factor 2 family protein n=1 Tax=Streptomyces sp. NPDC005566 TaxID=3156886 RepID=UPI0033A8D5A5